MLDESMPETPYTVDICRTQVQLIFDGVLTPCGDDGESAYDPRPDSWYPQSLAVDFGEPIDVNKIADDVAARIHAAPEFAAKVAADLGTDLGA